MRGVGCPGLSPEKAGIRGLSKKLGRKSPIFISSENHQVSQPVIVSFLRSLGYFQASDTADVSLKKLSVIYA